MKKLLLILLVLVFLSLNSNVSAVTPRQNRTVLATGSAARNATPSASAKDRQIQLATRSANIKSQNKFVMGIISNVTGSTLLLTTAENKGIAIDTNATTKFWDLVLTKKDIILSNLKVGDRVAVTGVAPTDTTGIARIVARMSEPTTHLAIWGTITSILGDNISLVVKNNKTEKVVIGEGTKLKVPGFLNPETGNLESGQKVIVTGTRDNKGNILSSHFYVIPGSKKAVVTPQITQTVSSSSGTPASGSAKTKKASPTPALP